MTSEVRGPSQDEFTLLSLAVLLLRRRQLLVSLPLGLAFLVGLVGLVLPRTYVSEFYFTPQQSTGAAGRLAGLAAQFGMPVGGVGSGFSAEFYVGLLGSPELRRRIVDSHYRVPASGGLFSNDTGSMEGSLVDILQVDAGSPEASRARAALLLDDMVSVSVGRVSGIVQVRVSNNSPHLAHGLALNFRKEVDAFNQRQRQDVAAAERKFVEARLEEAQTTLRTAEVAAERFLSGNRSIDGSPQLQFEYDRLRRDVAMAQQVVTTLQQSLEQARIEELRNTPVVTVVSEPEFPAIPARRFLVLKVIGALVVGGLLAIVLAIALEVAGLDARDDEATSGALRHEAKAAIADLRRPWRLLAFFRYRGRRGGGAKS